MIGNMKRVAACSVLVLLACALFADAAKEVAHKPSGKGLKKLRADIAAGRHFPEKKLVVGPDGVVTGGGTTESTQAVCGTDTSRFSSFKNVCKMYFTAADGNSFVCSAWLIARNKLGTAGHCVIDQQGFITSAVVVCGGIVKDVTAFATTGEYYNQVFINKGGSVYWADAGVLKVGTNFPGTLAFTPYRFRQAQGCSTSLPVTVAGYPAVNSGACHYDGVQQWKSKGPLKCTLQDGFYPSTVDSCGGGSGSRVTDADGFAVAIFVAEVTVTATGACVTNLLTKILDPSGSGQGVFMQPLVNIVDTV